MLPVNRWENHRICPVNIVCKIKSCPLAECTYNHYIHMYCRHVPKGHAKEQGGRSDHLFVHTAKPFVDHQHSIFTSPHSLPSKLHPFSADFTMRWPTDCLPDASSSAWLDLKCCTLLQCPLYIVCVCRITYTHTHTLLTRIDYKVKSLQCLLSSALISGEFKKYIAYKWSILFEPRFYNMISSEDSVKSQWRVSGKETVHSSCIAY